MNNYTLQTMRIIYFHVDINLQIVLVIVLYLFVRPTVYPNYHLLYGSFTTFI